MLALSTAAIVSTLVATEPVAGITAETVKAELARPRVSDRPTVIDVRRALLYGLGHIPGALNLPASICAERSLPPLGRVVVCGDGIDAATTRVAAQALAAKEGISVEILDGGYGRWEALGYSTVGPPRFRRSEPPTILYDDLVRAAASNPALVLVDLRRGRRPGAIAPPSRPVTRVAPSPAPGAAFAGRRGTGDLDTVRVYFSEVSEGGRDPRQYLLIDDGGRAAIDAAALLRARSVRPVDLPLAVVSLLETLVGGDPDIVVLDLRPTKTSATVELTTRAEALLLSDSPRPLTNLGALFPGVPVVPVPAARTEKGGAGAIGLLRALNRNHSELHVLIDDGDGRAATLADRLRAAGLRRVLFLAGGEEVLVRRGVPGIRKTISR